MFLIRSTKIGWVWIAWIETDFREIQYQSWHFRQGPAIDRALAKLRRHDRG